MITNTIFIRNFYCRKNYTLSSIILPKSPILQSESHVQALTSLIQTLSTYGSRCDTKVIEKQKQISKLEQKNQL